MDRERLIPLRDFNEAILHKAGLPPIGYYTLWRAGRHGTVARTGQRIFLKVDRLGGKLYTSISNISRYIDELSSADREHFQTSAGTKPTTSQKINLKPKANQSRLESAMRIAEEEGL